MKVSLAWIFDHIDADWKKQNVSDIVTKFNQVTAEIEETCEINIDLSPFFAGKILSVEDDKTIVALPEQKKKSNCRFAHSRRLSMGYTFWSTKRVNRIAGRRARTSRLISRGCFPHLI